ncbi:insulinase family protein [Clostridium sp. Marseille-P2415]|uniref:insulinase family protein n=1 Tax=Clostridium sp. Marseille-P2415 TaxID=1805471 RepID=UPI0009886D48|nr:insulinase family protein [Clostridium sp. Marseille-P2415]
MNQFKNLAAYEVVEEKEIKEINAFGCVLRHKKSGARIFTVSCDDENKVFSIGFRTPPADSTGVAHILEHSVLCGSDKFPVKDPFVELVKGSLNTFLNAMTYPDKTVYPVASCNEKDFQNLMNVYMDAVLHPNIYKEPKIFMQEGWHYELENPESDLIYNGVVYNEMKGAFSSPEEVLDRHTRKTLFPDNCYGQESGGDPAFIPDLTYENFLNFHRRYYHPSNSYIYLYGDMDMEEKLTWLHEEYLSHYDEISIDSRITRQEPFKEPVEDEIFYSITEGESEENATYLSVSTVAGTDLDPKLYIAFQILEYTLLDAPGAPLKQALIDAGIGQDILGGYDSGILQPYFSVIAKNANREQRGEFLAVIKGTLRKLADEGINKKSLRAGMNYYEFRYREADYGSAPKGLMYGLQCMDSWLYDGDPMMHLEYQKTFDYLKKVVDDGYFEQLIREYLLDNPFEVFLTVSPRKNLTAMEEEKTAKKLAAYKASLSEEEIRLLVLQTRSLKEYQETPSPQKDLEKIPMLRREDISGEPEAIIWDEKEVHGVKVIHHDMFTSGIGYLKVLFDTSAVPVEDLPYVGFLKSLLGYVNTENFTYGDLTSEIHLNSGGVSFSVTSYPDLKNKGQFKGYFMASARVMYEKLDFGFSILAEILTRSILDDEKRMGEVISETRSRARMKLEGSCHSAAVARATSYFSATSYFNDLTGGIGYYEFLEKLEKEYPVHKQEIIARFKAVMKKLFTSQNMLVSYTANEEGYKLLPGALGKLSDVLPEGEEKHYPFTFPAGKRNEGFCTASQVNYVARCGSFAESGLEYTGALKILKVILSYDYLWINLRVKGGAYGCMSGFGRSGEGYLTSYRDPNLRETNRIYDGIVDYLKNFQVEDRDMTKYVIGTISDMDVPYPPSTRGNRGLSAYLSGVDREMMEKEREEVLNATQEDIRRLAPIVKAVLDTGSLCVIGNEDKLTADKELFGEIKNLFHS